METRIFIPPERTRLGVGEIGEPDLGQRRLDQRRRLGPFPTAQAQRQVHVRRRIGPGQQRRVLEHEADIPGAGAMVPLDAAGARFVQPRQQAQQRGFAAARGAEQGHELARLDIGGDVVQRDGGVRKGLGDRTEGKHYFCTPNP
jgi:hypothetical protein